MDFLAENSTSIDLAEVAAAIVEREDGGDETDGAVERATLELHHNHLPKMDDFGLVYYDPRTQIVDPKKRAIDAVLSTDDS